MSRGSSVGLPEGLEVAPWILLEELIHPVEQTVVRQAERKKHLPGLSAARAARNGLELCTSVKGLIYGL